MLPQLRILPCRLPFGFALSIVPVTDWPFGPIGRCGHHILARHRLVVRKAVGVPVEVLDTSAMEETRRNHEGVRRAGPFGAWFGFSPHRCDGCKRAKELRWTIVCPCCRHTIVAGGKVSRIATTTVEAHVQHADLRPYFVTTEDGVFTVVCETCGTDAFDDQDEAGIWVGDAVTEYPSEMHS